MQLVISSMDNPILDTETVKYRLRSRVLVVSYASSDRFLQQHAIGLFFFFYASYNVTR